jgi:hypothetical protein
MSIFEYLATRRRAKALGGTVIKDKFGYHVSIQTDLKREDMERIPPEEVLRMYQDKDLTKMDPGVRESVIRGIQRAKEDIQARDERWRRK